MKAIGLLGQQIKDYQGSSYYSQTDFSVDCPGYFFVKDFITALPTVKIMLNFLW